MAKWGSVDFREFKALQKRLEVLQQADLQKFCEAVSKELAARLLAKVIKRTPTRKPENCPPGVVGGTLKRGWTGGVNQNAKAYADSLSVRQIGDDYVIEVKNPVEYASYVEFGHRTRGGGGHGWVEGFFMLTKSEMELESQMPKIIENKLLNLFGDIFNGK